MLQFQDGVSSVEDDWVSPANGFKPIQRRVVSRLKRFSQLKGEWREVGSNTCTFSAEPLLMSENQKTDT